MASIRLCLLLLNSQKIYVQGLQGFTMSNSTPSLITSKNANSSAQIPSPSQSQSVSSFTTEAHPQRRSGGSGSFGAGSTSRAAPFAARYNQTSRKQHKSQRRARLADEDAAAESVSKHTDF